MARGWVFRAGAAAAAGAFLALSGCGFPIDGLRGESVYLNATTHVRADEPSLPYCMVSLTPRIGSILNTVQPRFAGRFPDRRGPVSVRIGVGDSVRVTLFEAGAGGLFFPLEGGTRTGNFLVIPDQNVDAEGNITVPYAGSIRAKGRTPAQVQEAIVRALSNRALEPQAVVTVVDQRDALVTVLGEVGGATRFQASASGERVLDAIARSGGLRGQGQDSWVLLERNGVVAVSPFEALVHEPPNNVYVRAHDTIYVYKEPQTFLAFGAVTRQGQIPFEAWRLSLAEGIAKAGGLLDARAEPAWVFLFRAEHRDVAAQLDASCVVSDSKFIPVVYKIDLRDPATYFLTTHLPMRNKDLIFVSNAKSVETTKIMTYVNTINSTIQGPIETGIAFYALRAAIRGTSSSSSVIIGGSSSPTTPAP